MNTTETTPRVSPKRRPKYYHNLSPFPKGWFLICFSDQVKKGQIIPQTFMGNEVVIYRTALGIINVLDAYCSHMGAHLGHGGIVEGELIRCPFHGFCFNTEGQCVKNAYGTKPSPNTIIHKWHVREFNGIVLVYHDPDNNHVPNWEIPELDWTDWSPLVYEEFELKSHPQETAENSVDIGHLKEVHGYQEVKELMPLHLDGPLLNAKYFMSRPAGLLGRFGKSAQAEFEIIKYGLGYSAVKVDVLNFGLQNRHFVFPTPIDGNKIYLRIALSIKKIDKKKKISPILGAFPRKWLRQFLLKKTLKQYKHDVSQDFKIWENKIYINPPILAKGDGPIWKFRKWAEQFY